MANYCVGYIYIYSTRGQRRLSWERGAATAIAVSGQQKIGQTNY